MGPDARLSLREAVVAMDRARRRARQADNERALSGWKGLIKGRWSLLERFDADGKRFIVAFENGCKLPSPRALTNGEARALQLLGEGHKNTSIAEVLSLSQSTVSQRLASAASKLGSRSLAELGAWAAQFAHAEVDGYACDRGGEDPRPLDHTPRAEATRAELEAQTSSLELLELSVLSTNARVSLPGLTAAEQATIELVLDGMSRQEIAERRGEASLSPPSTISSRQHTASSTSRTRANSLELARAARRVTTDLL